MEQAIRESVIYAMEMLIRACAELFVSMIRYKKLYFPGQNINDIFSELLYKALFSVAKYQ